MVIRLYTDTSFANDIADELRLFTDAAILACEQPEAADVRVTLRAWAARAEGNIGGVYADYVCDYPPAQGGALEIKRCEKRAVKIAAFRMMRKLFDTATPWGSLTGIRPTRLYRELMERDEDYALYMMREMFDVSEEKLNLVRDIHAVQAPLLAEQTPEDMDVYIGIPFCKTRCLYCSFPSDVRTPKTDMAGYIAALKADIRMGAALLREGGWRLRSLYMGGGTPTVLTAGELYDVLACAKEAYGGFGREFTVEAGRPDTIDADKLRVIRDFGAQRISINPQSMNADTLERIGRSHAPEDIRTTFALARKMGFDNINMDVIAGLPGEDLPAMQRTLAAIAELRPDDLTVHTLALKRSSKLWERIEEYPLPSAATVQAMLLAGAQTAAALGLRPYYMYRQKYMRGNLENVGYARPGKECIYNVDMMEETTSIMAHGGGAMSKRIFGGERRVERIPNPKDIATYESKLDALKAQKRALFLSGRV